MNKHVIRQIVLDTETTGINKFGRHYEGHRVIEIGAVELINRRITDRTFHVYLQPNRTVDPEAFRIHGISDQFLKKQPFFSDIADEFLKFIRGSELIIHNAPFDLGFLNHEFKISNIHSKEIEFYCTVIDSLKIARRKFPGQRNNLNALCERYCINNDNRVLHNALIDAQLLANVFLSMTGGQIKMRFTELGQMNTCSFSNNDTKLYNKRKSDIFKLQICYASQEERLAHEKYLEYIQEFDACCVWKRHYM